MKFFKTLKRKAGNAIIPVVGTILGLTILAGTVVGVALHTSKIVYKEDNLENQNDARQILYIASKYFCTEINKQRDPSEIRAELQGFFGPGLKITQDKNDTEKFYIWYPNKFKSGKTYTTDDNVAEWLKATIKKTEVENDDGDHGDSGINKTLFSEEAKVDEKFAIGNMMTVYLTDEHLLPGRRYSINEVSLVESDIDTFDEAFTYMNNTGVLEIDDIGIALYKYGVLNGGTVDYIATPTLDKDGNTKTTYTIVYKTGNLGGNYYWQNGETSTETWLYRQEYDMNMLYNMICYYDSSLKSKLSASQISYTYDESTDTHQIISTKSSVNLGNTYKYTTSQKFADALAEYIFWVNLPRLAMNIPDIRDCFYSALDDYHDTTGKTNYTNYNTFRDVVDNRRYGYQNAIYVTGHYFDWTNEGLEVNINWKDYKLPTMEGLTWYKQEKYSFNDIVNAIQTGKFSYTINYTNGSSRTYNYENTSIRNKYCTKSGNTYTISYQALYDALATSETILTDVQTEYFYNLAEEYYKNSSHYNELINDFQNNGISYTNQTKYTESYYKENTANAYKKNNGNNYQQDPNGEYLRSNPYGSNYTEKFTWWNSYLYNPNSYYYNDRYDYVVDSNKYLNPDFYTGSSYGTFDYKVSKGNNRLTQDIIDYLNGVFKQKIENQAALNEIVSTNISDEKYSLAGFAGDSGNYIYNPQIFYSNGNFTIRYRYSVIIRERVLWGYNNQWVYSFRYSKQDWDSETSHDNVVLSYDEFFELFKEGIANQYVSQGRATSTQTTNYNSYRTEYTREYIKQMLVNPIRYQYLPTSNYSEILNNNVDEKGMMTGRIDNKLITYFIEQELARDGGDAQIKALGDEDTTYSVEILDSYYLDNLSQTLKNQGMFNYVVEFRITSKKGTVTTNLDKKISFQMKYITYSPKNNGTYNTTNNTYTDVSNNNVTTKVDNDGTTKYLYSEATIKNNEGTYLNISDLEYSKAKAILTAIPYTKRVNSTQTVYKDERVNIDGTGYTVITDYTKLKNVNTNVYYKGDVNTSSSDFKINIAAGKSVFIDGNLTLRNNQDLTLGANAMIYVNGNFRIEYDVSVEMQKQSNYYQTTWSARQLTNTDINTFRASGVDVTAGADAKIFVNGNFDYKGCKYKYARSDSFNITIANDDSGHKYDRVYEQAILNTGFKGDACKKHKVNGEEDGTWDHYANECRGLLEGIYIVNGDVNFLASNEKLITTKGNYKFQIYAMYSNAYSNPIINGTFYVDGTFDMTGLWTSGLYDKCRANFIFAKSIVEPYVQLNTLLCADNPQYAGWSESDGYLFVICEDAIDFSKDSFGFVNLFTPFQELLNAINGHKESETNFAEFIERDAFTSNFPNADVIDEWGLPSILRSGFEKMYSPGDIQTIKPEDEFNSAGDTVI